MYNYTDNDEKTMSINIVHDKLEKRILRIENQMSDMLTEVINLKKELNTLDRSMNTINKTNKGNQ